MIRKLAALGTILAGAAYLQNKDRRDRLMSAAKDFLGGAREKLGQFSEKASSQSDTASSDSGSSDFNRGSTLPGVTTRHTGSTGHVPPRGTGGNSGGIY